MLPIWAEHSQENFLLKIQNLIFLNMQRMDAHLVVPHATHPLLVLIALTNTTKGDRGGGCLFPKYFIGPKSKHCLPFMWWQFCKFARGEYRNTYHIDIVLFVKTSSRSRHLRVHLIENKTVEQHPKSFLKVVVIKLKLTASTGSKGCDLSQPIGLTRPLEIVTVFMF